MNYKHIDIEDYSKARQNFREEIRRIQFRGTPLLYSEEYKGCLFVYDDKFKEKFDKFHDLEYLNLRLQK
jgi:hypothetical protein